MTIDPRPNPLNDPPDMGTPIDWEAKDRRAAWYMAYATAPTVEDVPAVAEQIIRDNAERRRP